MSHLTSRKPALRLLRNFTKDCNRRPTAARPDSRLVEVHGALRTLHVYIVQQCLHYLQMIQKKQCPPNSPNLNSLQNIMAGERCMMLSRKLRPKPKTVSELKVAVQKTWENYPQKEAVQSFSKRLKEYVEAGGRHFEHLL